MSNNKVIVTKHQALAQYIIEQGFADKDTPILDSVSADNIREKDVLGVLPIRLAQFTRTYTEFPIELPKSARGKELTIEQVREFAKKPIVYMVIGYDIEVHDGVVSTTEHNE